VYPNKFNADHVFSGKFFSLTPDDHSQQFSHDYLYLAIYSD